MNEIREYLSFFIIVFLVFGILFSYYNSYDKGYQQGQADALNGIYKYELTEVKQVVKIEKEK